MSRKSQTPPPAADDAINPPDDGAPVQPVHAESNFAGSHAEELKARDPAAYAAIYGRDDDLPPEPEDDDELEEETPPVRAAKPAAAPVEPAAPVQTDDEPRVPLSRLNEVLARLDASEARERAREAATATPAAPAAPVEPAKPAFDLAAKIRERNAANWDGNEELAMQIELEIEAYREDRAAARALETLKAESTAETARTEFLDVAAQLTNAYPALDASKPDANKEAIEAVKAERDVQIAAGKSPAVALKRAVATIASEFGLTPVADAPPARRGAPVPAVEADTTRLTPRQIDAARMAARVAGTPPNQVGGAGYGDVKDDTREIGRDEWIGLSRAEKDKRLGIA